MESTAKIDVRKGLEVKLARLRDVATKLEHLPELRADAARAQQEHSAFDNDPNRRADDQSHKARLLELHGNMVRAREKFQNTEAEATAAQREIPRIEAKLSAADDIERLKIASTAIANDGAAAEKRVSVLRELVAVISDERAQAQAEATAARAAAAARANEARLEAAASANEARLAGKLPQSAKAAATKNTTAIADVVEALDAQLADAQQQLEAATDKLTAIRQQAAETRTQRVRAIALAAELDYLQTIEDVRPIVEHYAAATRLANLALPENLVFPLDEVKAKGRFNELHAECREWQLTTVDVARIATDGGKPSEAEGETQVAA